MTCWLTKQPVHLRWPEIFFLALLGSFWFLSAVVFQHSLSFIRFPVSCPTLVKLKMLYKNKLIIEYRHEVVCINPPPHRLKELRVQPYTQAEAERAAGMGSYAPPQSVQVRTQPVEEEMS